MFVSLQLGSALIGITSYCIFVYVQYTDTSYAYVATPLDSNFSVYNVLARGNTKRYICKSKRAAGVTFLTQSFQELAVRRLARQTASSHILPVIQKI